MMIDVELVPIDINIPSDFVRMVTMQPFVQIDSSQEPYRWKPAAKASQMDAIARTLEVASDRLQGPPAQFTIFPEYSLPGSDAINLVEAKLSSAEWPNETVVIAGVDGLPKSEYADLCQNLDVTIAPQNTHHRAQDNQWLNCCFIWVKNRQGVLQRWIQPKIRPAWPELNLRYSDMFQGSVVYIFECQYAPITYPCRFMTLICFDWVAKISNKTVYEEVLCQLNQKWNGSPEPLDWTFVIQHNPGPNKPSFLNNTYRFLTDPVTYQFVNRNDAAIVHINTAVSREPARCGSGAYSACVFSPRAQFDCNCCRPTVCMQPVGLRQSDILARCKDIVFREMGECIHSFQIRVSRFVIPDATDRSYPMVNAYVHGTGALDDPRLPGTAVPASVKWINDILDIIEKVSETDLNGCPLQVQAEKVEPDIITALRYTEPNIIEGKMKLAVTDFSKGDKTRAENILKNPDAWEDNEAEGLVHIIHSLTALGLSYIIDATNSVLHASLDTNNGFIQVVAIKGKTHEDCRQHFDSTISVSSPDPIIIITRDHSNLRPTQREFNKIFDTGLEAGLKILDYNSLISLCRESNDTQELRGKLDGYLPKDRRII
jgi:hypothetical protein